MLCFIKNFDQWSRTIWWSVVSDHWSLLPFPQWSLVSLIFDHFPLPCRRWCWCACSACCTPCCGCPSSSPRWTHASGSHGGFGIRTTIDDGGGTTERIRMLNFLAKNEFIPKISNKNPNVHLFPAWSPKKFLFFHNLKQVYSRRKVVFRVQAKKIRDVDL